MTVRVLFVDRDGTLVEEPADRQVDAVEKVRLISGVIPALLSLQHAGYRFVMVSNQDGLGTDSFPQPEFEAAHRHILNLFASQGIEFDEIFICPHVADDGCDCRKPGTGLLTRYLAATALDLDACAVIGDRKTDLELAEKLGMQGFLIDPDARFETSWAGICAALINTNRKSVVERTTRETSIRVDIDLNIEEPVQIRTGIGFYDHMLEQIARHAGFSLRLSCDGDLRVDEHHTVEDSALCLGTALRKALGDKRGIGRYGFLLPMDESEAQVALDLSGRGNFTFDGDFQRESVGGLPTELVVHFFQSFSDALRAALHIRVQGENDHHMVEACFKAVGRSLRQAIRYEGGGMPSTKGTLS
jgi:imidazoleglycerol-phosphate dehydratase/histidinol-phosphatase